MPLAGLELGASDPAAAEEGVPLPPALWLPLLAGPMCADDCSAGSGVRRAGRSRPEEGVAGT